MANVTIKRAGPALDDVKSFTVKDARGRILTLAEPNFLSEFRLMEAVGPELSSNSVWLSVFGPITYVTHIDQEEILLPTSKMQAEALIQRIGRDGYAAIIKALKEHSDASASDLEFAKNLVGTPDSDNA